MTEANPTPAESIPFALVDQTGHLTGKPAEGVTAMIQAATAELTEKLSQATGGSVSPEQIQNIITDHEKNILKAWQADPAYTTMISIIRDKQVWKGKNNSQRPGDLWLYLLSILNALNVPPMDLMGELSAQSAADKVSDWISAADWQQLQQRMGEVEDMFDYLEFPEALTELVIRNNDVARYGLHFWFYALKTALKLSVFRSLEIEGDYLKIVTSDYRAAYVQVSWEKPGA